MSLISLNAVSEAKYKDTGTPPVDSIAFSVMADMKNTQLSPVETPPADDTTVLVAEPNAETQKDLPATRGTSPTKLEDTVAPTVVSVDKLASPPTPASHTLKERQEYPQWIQFHSSQKAATVGSVAYKPGEPQQPCNCSSKQHKTACCLLQEEWQDLRNVSGSTSSKDSPELAHQDEEGKGAKPIIECLTIGGTPEGGPFLNGCP